MYNKKSTYAINKQDPTAIIYPDAVEGAVRLTRMDFASEEEFQFWKSWSDHDYHMQDNADVRDAKHTLSIEIVSEQALSVPGMEDWLLHQLETWERGSAITKTICQIKGIVTERQYHRMWLYYVEGMTQREIAVHESVGQQRISVSIAAAKKRVKKFFTKREKDKK